MKVYFTDDSLFTKALKYRVQAEGDKIVGSAESSDIIVSGVLKEHDFDQLIIGGDSVFPQPVTESFGIDCEPELSVNSLVAKWWNCVGGWADQTLVGFPIFGMMNQNLGAQENVGFASRYVSESCADVYFENPGLQDTLKQIKYSGFVSTLLWCEEDVHIVKIATGIPFLGSFNFVEGVPGKITDFFTDPFGNRLLESWVVSLLLTRFPYPLDKRSERVFIKGLTESVERHFWMLSGQKHRKSTFTDETLVGIATAWAPSLYRAARRAESTCWNLQFPLKQFRTDVDEETKKVWSLASELGIAGERDA